MTRRVGVPACLLLACLLALARAVWAAPQPGSPAGKDEIVPRGVLLGSVSQSTETQDQAIARDGRIHGLATYLYPDYAFQNTIAGTVTRQVDRTDLLLQYGISDTWNVSLATDWQQIQQRSSLSTTDPNPAIQAAVSQLPSQTVQGVGDVVLTSLHRPHYSDETSFVWGYGLIWPAAPLSTPYIGVGTLAVQSPYGSLFSLAHVTHYAEFSRIRFDARVEFQAALQADVNTPSEGRTTLQAGNAALAEAGLQQELEQWGYGLGLSYFSRTNNGGGGVVERDPVQSYQVHARVGHGNLTELEQGPIRFPYQVWLEYMTTVTGYNTPLEYRTSLTFSAYF